MARETNDVLELDLRDARAKVQGKLGITLTIVGTFVLAALWLFQSF